MAYPKKILKKTEPFFGFATLYIQRDRRMNRVTLIR